MTLPVAEQSSPNKVNFIELEIPDSLSASLLDSTTSIKFEDLYSDNFEARGRAIESAKSVEDTLASDPAINRALLELKDGQAVAVVLTGLPVDSELPPAPLDGGTPTGKKTLVSEGLALGIANTLGTPSLLLGEKKEALVHQVTPVPGRETTQSNEGQVDLKFHQDLAPNPELPKLPYQVMMPDYLILTGVQVGKEATRTYISSVDDAINFVSPESQAVLHEDRFVTNPPDSFIQQMPDIIKNIPPHPVLSQKDGTLEMAYDSSSNVRPRDGLDDQEAIAALAELDMALTRVKREVIIEPGTLVVFNNRRVAHGRSSVSSDYDPNLQRWIQRLYVFDAGRIAQEAVKRFLATQAGGGLIRLTPISSIQPSDRFKEMMDLSDSK